MCRTSVYTCIMAMMLDLEQCMSSYEVVCLLSYSLFSSGVKVMIYLIFQKKKYLNDLRLFIYHGYCFSLSNVHI